MKKARDYAKAFSGVGIHATTIQQMEDLRKYVVAACSVPNRVHGFYWLWAVLLCCSELDELEFDADDAGDEDMESKKLHGFEVVALCNLSPQNVDSCKALIPSIELRFSDAEIQAMLNILSKAASGSLRK